MHLVGGSAVSTGSGALLTNEQESNEDAASSIVEKRAMRAMRAMRISEPAVTTFWSSSTCDCLYRSQWHKLGGAKSSMRTQLRTRAPEGNEQHIGIRNQALLGSRLLQRRTR